MCLAKTPKAAPTPAPTPQVTPEAEVDYGVEEQDTRKKKRQSVTSQHRRNLSINTGGSAAGGLTAP